VIDDNKSLMSKVLSSPWLFIPAIYLISGAIEAGVLQYGTTIMYKQMGYSNAFIGYLSFLQMPLVFAFLWAPYVDKWGSKRNLSVVFLFITAAITAIIGFTIKLQFFFVFASVAAYLLLAFVFSFFKIAADGYYIRILDKKRQAEFIGVKTAAIRLGIIGSVAILIRIAGQINEKNSSTTVGWFWMYMILTAVVLAGAIYNMFFLPAAAGDKPVAQTQGFALLRVCREYLRQEKAVLFIIFVLVYRFGEGLLVRMADPFFMDPIADGGLNMSISAITLVKSFAGIPCTIIGGLAGGWIIKKFGLKKTFFWLALFVTVSHLGYWYIAHVRNMAEFTFLNEVFNRDMFLAVCVESLCYGMGFSAFFYYLHALANGKDKTSIFAISSALMGLGFYLPCALSGVLQEMFGYPMLFMLSFITAIPGVILILFLPLSVEKTVEQE